MASPSLSPLDPCSLVAVVGPPALLFHRSDVYIDILQEAGFSIVQREIRVLQPYETHLLTLNDIHNAVQFNVPNGTFRSKSTASPDDSSSPSGGEVVGDPSLLLLLHHPLGSSTSIYELFHSLRPHIEYVYGSLDEFMALRDTLMLFSSSSHASPYANALLQPSQYAFVLVKPGIPNEVLQSIQKDLIQQYDFNVIGMKQIQLAAEGVRRFCNDPTNEAEVSYMAGGPCWAIVVERANGLNLLHYVVGPKNASRAKWCAPDSLRGKYAQLNVKSEGDPLAVQQQEEALGGIYNGFYVSPTMDDVYRDIDYFFPATSSGSALSLPFEVSRVFALVSFNEHSTPQSALSDLLHFVKLNNFTIVDMRTESWPRSLAEEFVNTFMYKHHFASALSLGSEHHEEMIEFLVDHSPIHVLVMERINAIQVWNTCRKMYERHHRRFGVKGELRYLLYGSRSPQEAHSEMLNYFPNLPPLVSSSAVATITPQAISAYLTSTILKSNQSLQSFLTEALTSLCQQKCDNELDSIETLGKWMVKNNPNRPKVKKDKEEEERKATEEGVSKGKMEEEAKTGVVAVNVAKSPTSYLLGASSSSTPAFTPSFAFIVSTTPIPTPLTSHLTPLSPSHPPHSSTEFINVHDLLSTFASNYPLYRNDCLSHLKFVHCINVSLLLRLIGEAVANNLSSASKPSAKTKRFILLNFPWTLDACIQFEKHFSAAPERVIEVKTDGWGTSWTESESKEETKDSDSGVDKERKRRMKSVAEDLKEVEEHYKLFGKWTLLDAGKEAAETVKRIVEAVGGAKKGK